MNENPTISEPIEQAAAPADGTTSTPPPPFGQQPSGAQAPGQDSAGPQYYAQRLVRPPLRRSRTDRVFSGVCGGIGEQYGIDPVLLRILLVVAAVFTGGVFVLVYVLAWALIPDAPQWGAAPVPQGPGATAYPVPGTSPTAYTTSFASGGTGTYVDPATGTVHGPITFVAPPRSEPRSFLGLIAVSASLLVGGLLTLLAVSGVDVPAAAIGAAMLAVLGIGLLVGAFRGRARWLIAPAIILLLITQAATVIPRAVNGAWGAGTGNRTWTPTTAGPTAYELGIGEARLDLSRLPAGSASITAHVGLGHLLVILPADTTLVLQGRVGAGDITLPDQPEISGTSQRIDTTIEATTAADARTTVTLTADIGAGQLEVK